jgi:hypothetical protein
MRASIGKSENIDMGVVAFKDVLAGKEPKAEKYRG